MRVSSATRPGPFSILISGDRAIVRFAENTTEEMREDGIIYTYEEYQIDTKDRTLLKFSIERNFAAWFAKAKQTEIDALAAKVRAERNKLLADTDYNFLTDRVIGETERAALETYRQALRDISKQKEFPYKISWPEKSV